MGVLIRLGSAYHEFAGKKEAVEVQGRTVGACLNALIALLPDFRELLFNDEGALISIVICHGEVIVRNRFDQPVEEGSEITLLPMIEGG
jgi:sulfur-carrier protein